MRDIYVDFWKFNRWFGVYLVHTCLEDGVLIHQGLEQDVVGTICSNFYVDRPRSVWTNIGRSSSINISGQLLRYSGYAYEGTECSSGGGRCVALSLTCTPFSVLKIGMAAIDQTPNDLLKHE
jgi:hypothetical protein